MRNLLAGWRLKAGSGNTDAIERQKPFNVKKIRFPDGSDFLTEAIDPGAGIMRNAFSNLLVFLTVCLDIIRIVSHKAQVSEEAIDWQLKS
jgi:hypothetical protein